jgi:arylsulfatase A-like enzyme
MKVPVGVHRAIPFAALAWSLLVGAHLALQSTLPGGILRDAGVDGWGRVSLLGVEPVVLAAGVLLWSIPVARLSDAASRASGRRRLLFRALRILSIAAPLLALASSWGMFALSGQFFDAHGLAFVGAHAAAIFRCLIVERSLWLVVPPVLLVMASAVAAEILPGWMARRSPAGLSRFVLVCGLLLAASAGAGLLLPDPAAAALGRSAGPLTHLGWWRKGTGNLFERGVSGELFFVVDVFDADRRPETPRIVPRPVAAVAPFSSGIDQSRLRRWNVVVVLVDSLRADQLKAGGAAREAMPFIEALSREGIAFSDCISQASHTDLSAPAVFSSQYPLRPKEIRGYPTGTQAFPRVMIFDVLKSLGWRTALFSSQNEDWGGMLNYYRQEGGLDVVFYPRPAGPPPVPGAVLNPMTGSLDDGLTVAEALKWIDQGEGTPFFLFLNLQNAHLPFPIPADFPRRFGPARIDFTITEATFPKEKASTAMDLYADSLAYVDAQLGRLFSRLKASGAWDRTLLVVTGDHGESFYEHGLPAHANGVYHEVVHVPLIIRAPGLAPGTDGRPSQLIDVAPGIFHLLGLPAHPAFQGVNPFSPEVHADRVRFTLSRTPWRTDLAVLRSGYKLIRDGNSGATEIYNLILDPGERENLLTRQPQMARLLRDWLAAWRWSQIDYWGDPSRYGTEYPPLLVGD